MALNKEFLSGLGVSEDAITNIIAEHGKSIQAEQNKTALEKTRADNATTQLSEANKKLEGYDPEWKVKMDASQKEAETKISKMKFDHALNGALQSAGVKNLKAVSALIDKDALKLNGDELIGIDTQIDALKKSDGYLFTSAEETKPPIFTRPTSNGMTDTTKADKKDQANAAIRAAFGRN